MTNEQKQVRIFMKNAGQACPDKPTIPHLDVTNLRLRLIGEEALELRLALSREDLVAAYDAILDLLVVTIGTAVALGLDLEPGWQEVHRSNMTKFIDGYKRQDGKWIKGPSWRPPNLEAIVDAQLKGQ